MSKSEPADDEVVREATRQTRGLNRVPTLSRQAILEVAMRLTQVEDTTRLSLARLGRALGVDATAVYRHFRNKDDLVLALGDMLMQEAVADFSRTEDWAVTLETIALRLREVCLARPALSQQFTSRFTGGDGELEWVDHVMTALRSAGLDAASAARECRAFSEMTLAHIGLTATLLSLPTVQQERDVVIGLRLYNHSAKAITHKQVRAWPEAARANEDEAFRTMLRHFIRGLQASLGQSDSEGPAR